MSYFEDLVSPSQEIYSDTPLEYPTGTETDLLFLGLGATTALVIGYMALRTVCLSGRKRNCWFPCDPLIFQCADKVLTYSVTRKYKTRN